MKGLSVTDNSLRPIHNARLASLDSVMPVDLAWALNFAFSSGVVWMAMVAVDFGSGLGGLPWRVERRAVIVLPSTVVRL